MSEPVVIEGETVTRSQLYRLLWKHEAQAIAERCGFSGSLLGRVCRRWGIPKPGRGDWQQMEAGQSVRRPALPAWTGPRTDPAVLIRTTTGYGSTVPPKTRTKPKKPNPLDEIVAAYESERRREAEEEARHSASLLAMTTASSERHVLTVEDWHFRHTIQMGLHPHLAFEDASSIFLDCRYVLPDRRRGRTVCVEILFRWKRLDAMSGEMTEMIGQIDFRKRHAQIRLAEDAASTICTMIAAGHVRVVDLDIVMDGKQEIVRWGGLLSKTHDGVEGKRTSDPNV